MTTNFEIKSNWINSELGQKYMAKAVTATGRILAITTVDLPIEDGADFVSYRPVLGTFNFWNFSFP